MLFVSFSAGASESLISTFADLINSSGSFDRAAAEAVVGEAADKVSAAIGAKTGSAGQAVSAAACGMAAQAQAIAAEVSELAQATPDKAVNALVVGMLACAAGWCLLVCSVRKRASGCLGIALTHPAPAHTPITRRARRLLLRRSARA
jgi:hypothetical protein